MKILMVVLPCLATPVLAHHEVVVKNAAAPAMGWLGGIAAAGIVAAAIAVRWTGRRRL